MQIQGPLDVLRFLGERARTSFPLALLLSLLICVSFLLAGIVWFLIFCVVVAIIRNLTGLDNITVALVIAALWLLAVIVFAIGRGVFYDR